MSIKEITIAIAFMFFFGLGFLMGHGAGEVGGSHAVYKGYLACETLLDGVVRCVDTTKVKGKQ